MWGRQVGAVAWDADRALGSFEYSPSFRDTGLEVSPLRMPLSPAIYSFPELRREAFRGLPGMLADSLPDRWGNRLINTWLDRLGRSRDSFNPVERLCYVGSRGMGALEYVPALREQGSSQELEVDALADLARTALSQRKDTRTDLSDDGLATLLQVGTSAGGMRAKAIIAWNPESDEVRSGQVAAPPGFGYWIIKFDSVGSSDGEFADPRGYGRVEYAYHLMASAAGVDVAPARLQVDGEGRAHFMSHRFDRTTDGGKIHTQTLQGLAHMDYDEAGTHSWESALRITRDLCGASATARLYRRMLFNVVARNQDDHTKNISFLMDRDGEWDLAPAYDVTWAYNPASYWTARHQMTITGKRDGFGRDELLEVGSMVGVRKPGAIFDDVVAAVADWERYSSDAAVPADLHRAVSASLRIGL